MHPKQLFQTFLLSMFSNTWPLVRPNIAKGVQAASNGRGVIGKPIWGFGRFSEKAKLSSLDQDGCWRSLPDSLGVAWEHPDAVARQPLR